MGLYPLRIGPNILYKYMVVFLVFLQQPDFTGHQVRKGGQGGNFFKFERALGTTALTIQIWGYPNFLHNEWTLDHILRVKSALKSSNFFGCCPKYWRLKSRTPRRVKHHGLQCLHQRPSLCSASSSSWSPKSPHLQTPPGSGPPKTQHIPVSSWSSHLDLKYLNPQFLFTLSTKGMRLSQTWSRISSWSYFTFHLPNYVPSAARCARYIPVPLGASPT